MASRLYHQPGRGTLVGADGGFDAGVPLEVGIVETDEDNCAIFGGVVDYLPEELWHRDVWLLALGQVQLRHLPLVTLEGELSQGSREDLGGDSIL